MNEIPSFLSNTLSSLFILILSWLLLKLSWYQSPKQASMANLNLDFSNFISKIEFEQAFSSNVTNLVVHSTLPTLPVKLIEKNYGYWRSQVFPALASHDLDGFITGKSICPSMFLIEKSREPEPGFNFIYLITFMATVIETTWVCACVNWGVVPHN